MPRTSRIRSIDPVDPDVSTLAEAAEIIVAGGLVGMPTETVYGLGADGTEAAAVRRIFAAKRRPADNPLILHLARADELSEIVREVTPLAQRLADRHWPGPLTIVLDAAPDVPDEVRAGLPTVAVRVPAHAVARGLAATARRPLAAPSANSSGRPSPTTAAHVLRDLGAAVDLVLDAGASPLGVESTVVDARGEEPVILRAGALGAAELGLPSVTAAHDAAGLSPGSRHRHYAPRCRVELAPRGTAAARAAHLVAGQQRVGLIASGPAPDGVTVLAQPTDAPALARVLYAALRAAEDAELDVVVVDAVAEQGIGVAVMDRLRRAAAG